MFTEYWQQVLQDPATHPQPTPTITKRHHYWNDNSQSAQSYVSPELFHLSYNGAETSQKMKYVSEEAEGQGYYNNNNSSFVSSKQHPSSSYEHQQAPLALCPNHRQNYLHIVIPNNRKQWEHHHIYCHLLNNLIILIMARHIQNRKKVRHKFLLITPHLNPKE